MGGRIKITGEGDMFADVDIEEAKKKCTHIMQQSLRSDSKTASEEMMANFNENTYGLDIDFFDPPRCMRVQLCMDIEKLEFLPEYEDHETKQFRGLEEHLHQCLIPPLRKVGGIATKSFKIIALGEKGTGKRPSEEDETV